MTVFEKIEREIMADPMNTKYTAREIPPLYTVSKQARIAIVGQAPGRIAEETRLVWNDASGDRLREWMGISRETFYDSGLIAQLPMDFYYPGKEKAAMRRREKDLQTSGTPGCWKRCRISKRYCSSGAMRRSFI